MPATFHGRDLFAPVAGRLARGETPAALASPIAPRGYPDWPDDLPEIVYVDHYGNALTGLRGKTLSAGARLDAGGQRIGHAPTFSAVPTGTAFWYANANGLVEIAVNAGRADRTLGLAVGSRVAVCG